MGNDYNKNMCKWCNNEYTIDELYKHGNKYICKACWFIYKRENKGKKFEIANKWTLEEYKTLLNNILSGKIKYINELTYKLNNKSLEDIILVLDDIKIGNTTIMVEVDCKHCGEKKGFKLWEYKAKENHFCSKSCSGKYYGDIKSKNTKKFDRICQICGKKFRLFGLLCRNSSFLKSCFSY